MNNNTTLLNDVPGRQQRDKMVHGLIGVPLKAVFYQHGCESHYLQHEQLQLK